MIHETTRAAERRGLLRTIRCGIRIAAPALAATGLVQLAAGQNIEFSIDYTGGHIGLVDGCPPFIPVTEGDILTPATPGGIPAYGPLPPPCTAIPGGPGGLGLPMWGPCVGHPPGVPCGVEVDALSHGLDSPVLPMADQSGTYCFSVNECAIGIGGSPRPPAIWTEGPVGDSSADVFIDLGLPPPPLPPPGPIIGSTGYIDGNGLPSGTGWQYPGLGLFEPDFPGVLDGDDVDAIDLDLPAAGPVFPVFFSLDGAGFNPCTGMPKTGSAMMNGFLPGMILVTPAPGGPPAIYAPPPVLGLDLAGPPGSDDLDALALWENGVFGLQVPPAPYAWLMAAPTDMVLFSVNAGSAVIGMPDSIFGAPIMAGDILMPPVAGGLSPFPGIFIAAEWIGLSTPRIGGPMDNLDALDTRRKPEPGLPYCFGTPGSPCPCGNFGLPGNGCEHSFLLGGGNLTGVGNPFVSADSFGLTASNLPPVTTVLFFQAAAQLPFGAVFGDGLLCTAGPVIRLGAVVTAGGVGSWGAPFATLPISIGGAIPPAGGTRFYQGWYRNNAPAFCPPAPFNLTNAYAVVWVP